MAAPLAASTIRHLLAPLDGSPLAEAALPAAIRLAIALGAQVTLLHVLERGAPATVHGHAHLSDVASAEEYLRQVAARFPPAVHVETHVHPNPQNDVAVGIAEHAAELGADLIVLSTHGEGGARSWLAGTIAQQTIRRATPPVLLIRPRPDGSAPPFTPSCITVALDPVEHGDDVLPPSMTLARALGVPLSLLVIVPTLATLDAKRQPAAMLVPTATAAALDIERDAAAAYLRDLAAELREQGFAVRAEVGRGDAVRQVAESAGKAPADVLALGTHGKTGFDAVWSESVGSRVVGRVGGPLLLVHPSQGE